MRAIQLLLAIASSLLALSVFAQPGPPPANVNVINVPTVRIGNTNVPVTVQNSSLDPIPVESVAPTRIVFQFDETSGFETGSISFAFTVPLGSDRLVIEQVTGRAVLDSDSEGIRFATIRTDAAGVTADHNLNMEHMSTTGSGKIWVLNHHPVRFYADPGSEVQVTIVGDPIGSVDIHGEVSVSGYLIPLDSQSLAP